MCIPSTSAFYTGVVVIELESITAGKIVASRPGGDSALATATIMRLSSVVDYPTPLKWFAVISVHPP
ncbi:hypothetical protein D3C87_2198990 [compost metagenome]